jgi:hypothetical protein
MINNTNTTNQTSYFDLITNGTAYLNRAREVKPKGAEPFWSVTCAILRGTYPNIEYTYIDCIVRGKQAKEMIENTTFETINSNARVLAKVSIGDVYPDEYITASGPFAGKSMLTLKGRLINIADVQINTPTEPNCTYEHTTTGVAYLNYARQVTHSTNKPFWTISASALCGPSDNVEYRNVNTIVHSKETKQIIERISFDTINSDQRVIACVSLTNISANKYTPTKGKHIGKAFLSLKCKLSTITSVKIDGEQMLLDNQPMHQPQQTNVQYGHPQWPLQDTIYLDSQNQEELNAMHQRLIQLGYTQTEELSRNYKITTEQGSIWLTERLSAATSTPDEQHPKIAANQ